MLLTQTSTIKTKLGLAPKKFISELQSDIFLFLAAPCNNGKKVWASSLDWSERIVIYFDSDAHRRAPMPASPFRQEQKTSIPAIICQ